MRRQNRQKAVNALSQNLWNNMWQAFCPWVVGSDVSPTAQPVSVSSRRRRPSPALRTIVAAAVLIGGLSTFSSSVHAYENGQSNLLHKASLNTITPMDRQNAYAPQLFGASERRHSDLRPFTKWTGVLNRFKQNFAKDVKRPEVKKWLAFLGSLEGASESKKISAVNDYFNKVRFVADAKNYGQSDYWATPAEFLARGGDCEDYAVAKYISLRALGISKERMRLAIVNDSIMRMPHALLVVYQGFQAKILDNQNPEIMNSAEISRYKPIYSISQIAWWRH